MTVAGREEAVHAQALRGALQVRGRRVATYAWGDDGPPVVFVHGWRGRAAQFAPLVPTLLESGHRVLAFDAPAHGASSGGPVDIRDWLATLAELQRIHGRFRALVGHSFGGFSSVTAVRHGLEADAVVSIAGAGRPAAFLDEFSRMLRLDEPTRAELERRFLRRVGEDPATLAERYDALAHPLRAGVPLLVVHGDADRQLPLADSRALAAATPGSRLVVVPGAGHTRVLGAPETVEAVLEHLALAARPLA
ncbi:alpha/beta fold hydrolase [Protaetiibacter mangrovi]|uniref:Alpha/beta hydrolase n=1 Tax=Protaetiibacter mangrovi TaxID=2970926 RepID=A0ABT1ZGG8_9MICO|nr:alpha/beta hydrolase [Protaetiibacter mangrovi]MCS0499800.1 alpha/beta hydrolase [Protaetiibacter mangrovi]